jgi:GNAT superfamily N-acetyltransferase
MKLAPGLVMSWGHFLFQALGDKDQGMTLIPVPPGEIATIVTSLEMRERPKPAPFPPAPMRLVRWDAPSAEAYRTLYRRVGEPWLWFSRLMLSDEALRAILHDPQVSIWAVTDRAGIEVGIIELDFRTPHECEIAFFGLVPELTGKGLGRWMMAQTLAAAWKPGISRVWVHTCTLDGPTALGFYRRAGFEPYATAVEQFPDPRLSGLIPAEAAPQIPLLGSSISAR